LRVYDLPARARAIAAAAAVTLLMTVAGGCYQDTVDFRTIALFRVVNETTGPVVVLLDWAAPNPDKAYTEAFVVPAGSAGWILPSWAGSTGLTRWRGRAAVAGTDCQRRWEQPVDARNGTIAVSQSGDASWSDSMDMIPAEQLTLPRAAVCGAIPP
jgi:hypothetical protein